MLHSKATAALLKLKEIDKKYRIKSTKEIARQPRSLSDISAVDSGDEMSSSVVVPSGSGDSHDAIARPKLDIRMPEAYMERPEARGTAAGVGGIEPPAELVTIFDKSEKNLPLSSRKLNDPGKVAEDRTVGPAGEENDADESAFSPLRNSSSKEEEERTANTESSISEEVQEVVPSTPRSSPLISGREVVRSADKSSAKSFYSSSVIDGSEERAQSLAEENWSTLEAPNTYSDDFVETESRVSPPEDPQLSIIDNKPTVETGENVIAFTAKIQEPKEKLYANILPAHDQRRRFLVAGGAAAEQTKETVELVAPKMLSNVPSECDVGLDPALSDYVKSIERLASGNEDSENRVQLLSRSSQAASARGSKTRRRKGRRRAVTSREFSSSSGQRTDSVIGHKLGSRETQKTEESRDESNAAQATRSLKEEIPKPITRGKIVTKIKTESAKNRLTMRVEAPSTVEPAPNRSKDCSETQEKSKSAIQSVPEMMIGSKNGKKEKNVGSKHPSKRGDPDRRRNRIKKKSGSPKEGPERFEGIVTQELRQLEERDQLRLRVRGYIQEIMDERERLLVPDGFGVPVDKHARWYSGASRLRQSESPRRYFFKPLDLPNVAGFKRPDFGEHNGDYLNRNEECKNFYKIRDRIIGIRHWLSEQFVHYKDYSNLALTINAKYVPVTLKETKKMIRDMQQCRNGFDRCGNCNRLK